MVQVLTALIGLGAARRSRYAPSPCRTPVDKAHLGVATGVLTFLRSLGSALGVAMLGAVALGYGLPLGGEALRTGAHVTTAEPFAMIFLVCSATTMLGFVMLWLMPEKTLRGYAHEEVGLPE